MRLVKYKVNKFRSVKGTDWIEVDQWSCFVGVNESGKTNLLLPLWKFNPADDATEIDPLLDYPRDEFHDYDGEDGDRQYDEFVEVLFELSDEELDKIKSYEKDSESDEEEGDEDDDEAKAEARTQVEFTKYLVVTRAYSGDYYIYLSNTDAEKLSEDLEDAIGEELSEYICDLMPKFVYYSEYGNLDSDIYLPRVIEDFNRIESLSGKERMKARTLKILFGHLNLSTDQIYELGVDLAPNNDPRQKTPEQIEEDSRKRMTRLAKVNSAATSLTKQFRDWWTQGDYTFHFNADGNYFRILVSDDSRSEPIELESRSKGLQWFFSFFLVFLAESKDAHSNCILLLDEPGLSLHPNAQMDLISFFNNLSERNQLIYTTHLPFLVDHNNLDRVKAVYTEKGLTKATNDLN